MVRGGNEDQQQNRKLRTIKKLCGRRGNASAVLPLLFCGKLLMYKIDQVLVLISGFSIVGALKIP